MEILYEIFTNVPRQGPGGDEFTKKALSYIPSITEKTEILDIGSGEGAQTIALARNTGASVKAIDNYQPFLDSIRAKAKSEGLTNILPLNMSMDKLDFPYNSFDIIWCEAAVYILGMAKALNYWKQFIKPEGHMVISEVTWLTDKIDDEVESFWHEEYPGITSIDGNLSLIKESGFKLIHSFVLPESAWLENFYLPVENRLNELRIKYTDSNEKLKKIESIQHEIDIYRKYKNSYGYVFFIMQNSV